jgi:hypothetical protein
MRQIAFDASRLTGKARPAGLAADVHAKMAESALRRGDCETAQRHLKEAEQALQRVRALRRPSRRRTARRLGERA